ncbi:MAG: hypothetical protein FWD58_06440 [Firmicutes bacterium]|nr:hypothetical protein [Bacillota bacterium]
MVTAGQRGHRPLRVIGIPLVTALPGTVGASPRPTEDAPWLRLCPGTAGASPCPTGNRYGFVTAPPGTEDRRTAARGVVTRSVAECPKGAESLPFGINTPAPPTPPPGTARDDRTNRTTRGYKNPHMGIKEVI